jgi:hypothetical protein
MEYAAGGPDGPMLRLIVFIQVKEEIRCRQKPEGSVRVFATDGIRSRCRFADDEKEDL